MISHFFAGECTERGSRVKALRFAPMNAHRRRGRDWAPSPLLVLLPARKKMRRKWDEERNPDLLLRAAASVTVTAGSDERVNQANDRALIPFRQRLHALKSLP